MTDSATDLAAPRFGIGDKAVIKRAEFSDHHLIRENIGKQITVMMVMSGQWEGKEGHRCSFDLGGTALWIDEHKLGPPDD